MPEGNILALASMSAGSRDINSFGKLLRMMQWISHCVLWQIDYVGVLFGLWPRFLCCFGFCCLLCFSAGETQVWLGDLRVVVFCWFLWLCVGFIDLLAPMDLCPCTNVFFCLRSCKDRAISATSAKLEGKKKVCMDKVCLDKVSSDKVKVDKV